MKKITIKTLFIIFTLSYLFFPLQFVKAQSSNDKLALLFPSCSYTAPTPGGGGGGTTPTPTPGGSPAEKILNKACEYVKSVRSAGCVDRSTCSREKTYNKDRVKEFSDCNGFDITVMRKSGVDPNVKNTRAKDAIRDYYSKHKDKYKIIHPVTSTKQLKPGDLLFNVDYGSHASIYSGSGYCGCKGNALSASLHDHGPQCSGWYGKMSWAVRTIK